MPQWKVTRANSNGKYAISRERDGKTEVHKYGYIFADAETAQRFADDLNNGGKSNAGGSK